MKVSKKQLKVFVPLLLIFIGVGFFILKTPSSSNKEVDETKKVTVKKRKEEQSKGKVEEVQGNQGSRVSSETDQLPEAAILVGKSFAKALFEYNGDQPNSNVDHALQYVTEGLSKQMRDTSQLVRSSDDLYMRKVTVMDVQSSASDSYIKVKISGEFFSKAGVKTEDTEASYLVYLIKSEGGAWQVSDYAMLRNHDSGTE